MRQNKSAFVRGLPTNMPAADVIAKAKAKGMKLTPAYIYSIRTATKAKPKKKLTFAAPKESDIEARAREVLLMAAAELGYARAIELIQSARASRAHVFSEKA